MKQIILTKKLFNAGVAGKTVILDLSTSVITVCVHLFCGII